jgi:glucose-6-phosphate isomerase
MDLARMERRSWRDLGVVLDVSEAGLSDADLASSEFDGPFRDMVALEAGAVANPDEGRMVGHYWLRLPEAAPVGLGAEVVRTREACREVAAAIHRDGRFKTALILGIGGSALGPQLVADALGEPEQPMRVQFVDNTDPDGMARVIGLLDLECTIFVVISKSGGTPETRNAMVEVMAACERAGVAFAERAIAISGEGSKLWDFAAGWRARLPMWDWVGGRTSVTSAVGLLPMFLQGIDADGILAGAAAMDAATRVPELRRNPAALLALAWHRLGEGRGSRAMVMLPYRDRLVLMSRYLQQLVMESLGKERDLAGNVVRQGIAVYGNKGSTDQHAYVQQLRDGPDNYFATFLGIWDDGYHGAVEVEPGVDSGDYLQGLLLGTRDALAASGHPSITLFLDDVDAFRIGALIALYERAVGLYAARVGINAYHQPGVEAGKKAAASVLASKAPLLAALDETARTAGELAERAGVTDAGAAWALLTRLAANGRGVRAEPGASVAADRFARA